MEAAPPEMERQRDFVLDFKTSFLQGPTHPCWCPLFYVPRRREGLFEFQESQSGHLKEPVMGKDYKQKPPFP
jgi:hypothetical protein